MQRYYWKLVIMLCAALLLVLPSPAQTQESGTGANPAPNYTVAFQGSTYDGTATIFTYVVTGMGIPTALSHFDLEIPHCSPLLELIGFSPTDAVELGIDPTTGVDGIKWDLPLGEAESRTYSVTFLGYVAEGEITAAVKNGDGFFTITVPGPSCAQPELELEKYVSIDGGITWHAADTAPGIEAQPDGQVWYRFVLHNTGNVPLNSLTLTDNLLDTGACVLPALLEADASAECVLGPFTAAAGTHTNVATASGQYQTLTAADTDSASYFTGVNPAVTLKKYVAVGGGTNWVDADTAPGAETLVDTPVLFRLVVTNSGNVPLTAITLTDTLLDTASCILPAALEPGLSFECILGPLLAQSGLHTNSASVTALGGSVTVTATDTASYTGLTQPVIINGFIVAFISRVYANGQTIFTYTVTGTGVPPDLSHFDLEIPLCATPLAVTAYLPTEAVDFGIDPTTGINGIKWDLPLGMNASRTYSITFAGNVAQGTVLAAVKGGNGFQAVLVPGPACEVASIDLEKYVSLDGGSTWLDADTLPGPDAELTGSVQFRFAVTNDGTSELSGIRLTDNLLDLSSCSIPATLPAGAFFECIIGPLPVTAGQHTNVATVQGLFADGSGLTVDSDSASYFGGDRPMIDVEGFVSSNGGATWIDADAAPGLLVEIGAQVSYLLTITNTGTVTLTALALSDSLYDLSGCVIPAELPPDASFNCMIGSFTALEGSQTNTTTVSAAAGTVSVSDTDSTSYTGAEITPDEQIIIIIEGPVRAINANIIVIYDFEIELSPDDPLLVIIQVGDLIRVEGAFSGSVIVVITLVFVDVDVVVENGAVWRDSGDCANPPPPWAPAVGWRARCEGSSAGSTQGGGSPGGNGGGGNGDQLVICHVSPGNGQRQTITVDRSAWENEHSRHGDTLGPCR